MTTEHATTPRTRYPRAQCEVSVALCTLNGSRWIEQLLQSIAAQELLPDEVVIQDDCSEDDTVELIKKFAGLAPFAVRVEVNESRLGSTANFATALARCHGRFIALADQDDVWYPIKLRRLIDELELDPTVTMVFSDADLIGPDGEDLGQRLWDARLIGRTLRKRAVVPEELFARRALTTGCTMAMRRRSVAASLPFPDALDNEDAPMRHDRWLSLVAASVGTVRALPESLLGFRVHPDQETGVLLRAQLAHELGRAASAVFTAPVGQSNATRLARANQLEAAAERANEMGDFEEALTLEAIAAHHRSRVQTSGSVLDRLRGIAEGVRSGAYGWDRIALVAIAGDTVRSVRPGRRSEPDPGMKNGSGSL
jgi:hypothetical protein